MHQDFKTQIYRLDETTILIAILIVAAVEVASPSTIVVASVPRRYIVEYRMPIASWCHQGNHESNPICTMYSPCIAAIRCSIQILPKRKWRNKWHGCHGYGTSHHLKCVLSRKEFSRTGSRAAGTLSQSSQSSANTGTTNQFIRNKHKTTSWKFKCKYKYQWKRQQSESKWYQTSWYYSRIYSEHLQVAIDQRTRTIPRSAV